MCLEIKDFKSSPELLKMLHGLYAVERKSLSSDNFKIKSAKYGAEEKFIDVTDQLKLPIGKISVLMIISAFCSYVNYL